MCINIDENIKLVLASASPRRLDLLRAAGLNPEVCAADVVELTDNLPPAELVAVNAEIKARAVAASRPAAAQSGEYILAADTVVALPAAESEPEGQWRILGKPGDAAGACAMLQMLSGREHSVFTGVAVWQGGRLYSGVQESRVRFRQLGQAEIAAYVAGGEPLDKAGAYAIQGGAAAFVESLAGDMDNVIGLPLQLTADLLAAASGSQC